MKITLRDVEACKKANSEFYEGRTSTPPWEVNKKFEYIISQFFDKKNDHMSKSQFINYLVGNSIHTKINSRHLIMRNLEDDRHSWSLEIEADDSPLMFGYKDWNQFLHARAQMTEHAEIFGTSTKWYYKKLHAMIKQQNRKFRKRAST